MGERDKSVRSRNGGLRDDESGTKERMPTQWRRGEKKPRRRRRKQEGGGARGEREDLKENQGESSLMPSLLLHFAACDDR